MTTTDENIAWDTREFVPDATGRRAWYLTPDGSLRRRTVVGWLHQWARNHNPDDFEPYKSERVIAAVECNGIAIPVNDSVAGYVGFWCIADAADGDPSDAAICERLAVMNQA